MGHHAKKKGKSTIPTKEELQLIRKERKQKLKAKRAKLVVRNLPFNASEDELKAHFEKFGELDEIKILKKEDGLRVGCAFIQFKLVQKAAKARHHTNGKPFLGRDIVVNFALSKDKFLEKIEVKKENDVEVKEEPGEENAVKTEEDKSEPIEIPEDSAEENSDEDGDDEDETEVEEEPEKKKFESNDVSEGKTIFVKNVPFSATNDDLKECMKRFGRIYYALICVDKFTEHSKGTAFVKFLDEADAEKALLAGTELTLHGNILDCHKALHRTEIHQRNQSKQEEKSAPKDSRNLYLVKEGVVLAGSKSAEGVSATDMARRLQLEQYKTQMLRNLNMYIARERLVIHNLPSTWDDAKFRLLVKNNSPQNAVIREARVMRDMRNVDAQGVGVSKEFGFATFKRHDDAISCLRSLNNNPNIFSAHRRPIVAFSIENKSIVKGKQRRLEKSLAMNPKSKHFSSELKKKVDAKKQQNGDNKKQQKGANKKPQKGGNEKQQKEDKEHVRKAFVGVEAKPGPQKMRSRYNLKTQAILHHENMKKAKQKQKFAKKTFKEKEKEFTKQPKQKIQKKNVDDNFGKLVNNYKKMLDGPAAKKVKKFKWDQET